MALLPQRKKKGRSGSLRAPKRSGPALAAVYGVSSKEGMVVSFAIHPNAMPPELALAPMTRKPMTFIVTLVPPSDVTVEDVRAYIADAVASLCGCRNGNDPMFDLDRDSVTVRAHRKSPADGPSPRLNDTPNRSAANRDRYRYTLDSGQKAVVRASLLCKEERFWRWQERVLDLPINAIWNAKWSAEFLRDCLGIESRSEIASNEEAFRRFLDFEYAYRGHAEERG